MGLTLTVDRYVYLKQSDDGARIVEKKRFSKGDDLSGLPKAERDRLVDIGAASESDEEQASATLTDSTGAALPGEATDVTGGMGAVHPDSFEPDGGTPEGEDDESESEEEDEVEEDEYDAMSYADLQAEAKEREGVSAAGSADDIRARLREHDAENAS